MIDEGYLTPFQDVCTRTISNCGKSLYDVIEHVLSFSDGDAQVKTLERVDLLHFVEEIIDATWAGKAQLKSKGLPLEVVIKVDLTHLRHPFLINRGEVGRIIMNIFGNSIKYTTAGYLSVTVTAADPPFHADGHRKQFVTMVFEDTGKGIDEKFLPNLFTPFMQEDSQCDGVGLGMSLVKQIVENSGGTISVKSECGKGTKVEVRLLLEALKVDTPCDGGLSASGEFAALRNLKFAVYKSPHRQISPKLLESLVETCTDTFSMQEAPLEKADVILLINSGELEELRQLDLTASIVIFAPIVRQGDPRQQMFLQVPVGPYKLGRAIRTAIEAMEHSLYQVRRSSIVHLDPISPPTSAPIKQYDPINLEYFVDQRASRACSQTEASSTPGSEMSSFSFGRPKIEPLQTIQDETDLSTEGSVESSGSSSSRPYCLCVDDNIINLRILAALLKKEGVEFDTAHDGQQALDKFKATERPFDLVFTDINMPVLDGISAVHQIRQFEVEQNLSRCIVAALTGGGELEGRDITAAGFDQFFKKPVSMKTLSAFLTQLQHRWR